MARAAIQMVGSRKYPPEEDTPAVSKLTTAQNVGGQTPPMMMTQVVNLEHRKEASCKYRPEVFTPAASKKMAAWRVGGIMGLVRPARRRGDLFRSLQDICTPVASTQKAAWRVGAIGRLHTMFPAVNSFKFLPATYILAPSKERATCGVLGREAAWLDEAAEWSF